MLTLYFLSNLQGWPLSHHLFTSIRSHDTLTVQPIIKLMAFLYPFKSFDAAVTHSVSFPQPRQLPVWVINHLHQCVITIPPLDSTSQPLQLIICHKSTLSSTCPLLTGTKHMCKHQGKTKCPFVSMFFYLLRFFLLFLVLATVRLTILCLHWEDTIS